MRPEVLKTPINGTPLVPSQAPERMESGMTGREVVSRAASWWDSVGAPIMRKQLAAGVNYDKINQDVVVLSQILCGVEWEHLDKQSRFKVVKIWHDTYIAEINQRLVDDRITNHKGFSMKPRDYQNLKRWRK
jgi:hypothetical protein